MAVYELTAPKFLGSTDDTDHLVWWLLSEDKETAQAFATKIGGKFWGEVDCDQNSAAIDGVLPADEEDLICYLESDESMR